MRNTLTTIALAVIASAGIAYGVAAQQKAPAAAAALPKVTVYKTSSCGCCKLWVDHMNANGFVATVKDMDDVNPIKRQHAIAEPLWSCHTGIVGGYVIEGHVPAADIKRLLKEKPAIAGLSAPGMPQGSPGMEQGTKEPYDVIAFTKDGRSTVFAKHK